MIDQDVERPVNRTRSTPRWFAPVVIVLLSLLAGYAHRERALDWDLLAYVGCAEELRGGSPEDVYAAAYGSLDGFASVEDAARLRGGPDSGLDVRVQRYRQGVADDPAAFSAQLPFYRGRVLFVSTLALAAALGANAMNTASLIALLSGLALALVLVRWTTLHLAPAAAVIVATGVILLADAPRVMATGTPDMLASALLVGAAYLLVETQRRTLGCLLLVFAVATRADHALLAAALLAWLAIATPTDRRPSSRWFVLAIASLVVITWFCTAGRGSYGWWTVFHHSFARYELFPPASTPPRDIGFATAHTLRSMPMFLALRPLVFTLCGLLAVALGWRARRWKSDAARLAAFTLAAVAAHFALFPALWPRLMLPYWTLCLIGLCMAWTERTAREARAIDPAASSIPRAT